MSEFMIMTAPILLPWEKVVGKADRMRENHCLWWFSLISHAPHDSFSQGRSGRLAR